MPKRWVQWISIAAVLLMLAAMAMYVLSDDEALEPTPPATTGNP